MKIERSRKVPRTNRVPDVGAVLVPECAEQRPAKVGEVVQVPSAVRQHLLIQSQRAANATDLHPRRTPRVSIATRAKKPV